MTTLPSTPLTAVVVHVAGAAVVHGRKCDKAMATTRTPSGDDKEDERWQ
jgi:hypothetical protein